MAISESSRLCASLKKENVPVKRLIANQILPPSASDCKFCAMKRKVSIQLSSSLYGLNHFFLLASSEHIEAFIDSEKKKKKRSSSS